MDRRDTPWRPVALRRVVIRRRVEFRCGRDDLPAKVLSTGKPGEGYVPPINGSWDVLSDGGSDDRSRLDPDESESEMLWNGTKAGFAVVSVASAVSRATPSSSPLSEASLAEKDERSRPSSRLSSRSSLTEEWPVELEPYSE